MRKIKHIPASTHIIWFERVIFMSNTIIFTAGNTPALCTAKQVLYDLGITIAESPAPDVTHLLLPVPSFEADGRIKGGGMIEHILADLPEDITVIGGLLQHPFLTGYKTIDLLADPYYLAHNAAITADCAIRVAGAKLPRVFSGCPILIIGWGRIGKCLANQLQAMGARVTVAARKEADRAMLRALGFCAEDLAKLGPGLIRYRVIFNTAPGPVLSMEQLQFTQPDCLLIDLASERGIDSKHVLWARGLPGKDAPESSGTLIAKSVIRLLAEKEVSA